MAVAEIEQVFSDFHEPGSGDVQGVVAYASRYILDGERPFPTSDLPQTQEELAQMYPARCAYLGTLLERVQSGDLDDAAQGQAIQWFGMMNNLSDYVQRAKTDPHTRVLYEQQVPVIEDMHEFMEREGHDHPRGYVSLPMATGKTVLFTEFAKATGARTLVVAPSREIVDQTEDTFHEFSGDEKLDIGRVYTGKKRFDKHITITTYSSLRHKTDHDADRDSGINPNDYQLVILDEAHHAMGEKTRKVLAKFGNVPIVGFTASEDYSAKRRLEGILPTLIHKSEIPEVVESGLIAPFVNIIMKCHADMSKVEVTTTGDYEQGSLQRAVNTPERNNAIAEVYEKVFRGFRAIGSCAGIDHAIDLAQTFRDRGINAQVIHGKMTPKQRKAIMDGLKKPIEEGGIEIVFNDKVLTEGVNFPGVSLCLNAAPTLSFVREKQRGGRSLRLNKDDPTKVAIIWDTVDENYNKPPVLFADPEVAGTAAAFPSWVDETVHKYHLPALDNLVDTEEYEMLIDPDQVSELAQKFADGRSKPRQQAPEGWMVLKAMAREFNVPEAAFMRAFQELKEIDPDFVKEESQRFMLEESGAAVTGVHYSWLIMEALRDFIDEPGVAPVLWRTADHVITLYQGLLPREVTGRTLQLSKYGYKLSPKLADYMRKFVAQKGESRTRHYFSDEVVAGFAKAFDFPDYSRTPPPTWKSEETLKTQFGPEVFNAAMERLKEKNSKLIFSDIVTYEAYDNELGNRYFSPNMQDLVGEAATPPSDFLDIEDLADALETSVEEAQAIVDELHENKRLTKTNTFLGVRNNKAGLFFRDDMPDSIRSYLKYKEIRTLEDLKRQRNLGQMIGELTVPKVIKPENPKPMLVPSKEREHTSIRGHGPTSSSSRSGSSTPRESSPTLSSVDDERERAIIATLSPTLQVLYEQRKQAQKPVTTRAPRASTDNNGSSTKRTYQDDSSSNNTSGESSINIKSTPKATEKTAAPKSRPSTTHPVKVSSLQRARMRQEALAKFSRT